MITKTIDNYCEGFVNREVFLDFSNNYLINVVNLIHDSYYAN